MPATKTDTTPKKKLTDYDFAELPEGFYELDLDAQIDAVKKLPPAQAKDKLGTPTKYHPIHCELIKAYFSAEPYKEVETVTTGKGDYCKTEIKLLPNQLPTKTKYARFFNTSRQTLDNWGSDWSDFFDALRVCDELYKDFLNDNGLTGLYNASYAKFVAVNTTDMRDKAEHTFQASDELREALKRWGAELPN